MSGHNAAQPLPPLIGDCLRGQKRPGTTWRGILAPWIRFVHVRAAGRARLAAAWHAAGE